MSTLPPRAQDGNPSIPEIPGIYKITCTTTGKIYVGSSVNLQKRKRDHFGYLRKNNHQNSYLQRAFNKYGEDAFIFEVIEFVLIPEMLTAREQFWFGKLKPFGNEGFNIARTAGAPRLGIKHTPETCAKIGLIHIGNKYNLGKIRSLETREKLRQSHLGKPSTFKHKAHTPEAREKLRHANLGKKRARESIEKARQSNTGKKRDSKQNEENSQSKIAYYASKKEAGENNPNQGKKRTPEQREKFQQAQQKMRAERQSDSSTGFRGIRINEEKRPNRRNHLMYKFTCQSTGCKISKTFPYTEEGLDAAKVFAEAHYAAINPN